MTETGGPRLTIEPLDPARHDRAGFSCGVEQVDNFFRKTANKLTKADNLRVFVLSDAEGRVMGFHALNAHAIGYADLPHQYARARAGHGRIPAAYISMIGVDKRYQGQGYGGDLLADSLKRVAQAADAIGIAIAMLDVLDCGNPDRVERRKRLYQSYGFIPLPSNPLRLFMPIATIRHLLAGPSSASPPKS